MSAATAEVVQMSSTERAEIVEVAPDMAALWLGGNTHNRGLRPSTVTQYARDMAAGKWLMTGEAIKFAADGTLLDGQHRLWAVIDAGVPVRMLVMYNVDSAAQDVMDSGLKRTASDALGLAGYGNRTLLASVANLAIALESGINARAGGLGRAGQNSHTEIIDWVKNHPSVLEPVRLAHTRYSKTIDAPPTSVAYAYWQMEAINPDLTAEFFEGMATMSTSGAGDPRLAAMRYFMRAKKDRVRVSHTIALSILYRTWNAWRKGKRLTSIRTEVDGKPIAIPSLSR